MQKLRSLIVYALVTLCCSTQIVSEVKAAEEGSGKENWRRMGETVIYGSNAPTKVTVVGNRVLVPVTLVYQGTQVDAQLLLDTGASGTVINTDIADRLNVDLSKARRTHVRVVGGAIIEAHRVTLSRLTVGPCIQEKIAVFVIPHTGPAAAYDGLLGMDVLGSLQYRVDLKKQLILWE